MDITHLPSRVTGRRFYLYMITNVFSRKVVGAEVYERESGQSASAVLQRSVWKENCRSEHLVLHAVNTTLSRHYFSILFALSLNTLK